jgi:hypothetical protein
VRYRFNLFGPAFTFVLQGLQHIDYRSPNDRVSCRPPSHSVLKRGSVGKVLLRKEVIQPQVPLRLPCYDFIPVTAHTLGPCLLAVSTDTSGTSDSHDVTGGVYKARERIHGAVADAPLLAIPASCRRVAAYNPNWAQFLGFPPPRGFGSFCTGHCSTCAALAVRAILT